MCKQLKPGQLCTIDGEIYRCSQRVMFPCCYCARLYGGVHKTPCKKWTSDGVVTCTMRFGKSFNLTSFPILVSMCKK